MILFLFTGISIFIVFIMNFFIKEIIKKLIDFYNHHVH